MSKKLLSVSFVIILLCSLFLTGVGSAAELSAGNRYGRVKAVAADKITIVNLDGAIKTILVNSTTQYFRVTGAKRSLKDVLVKSWIFASGTNIDSATLSASTIILVPKAYSGAAYWDFRREYGTVTSVTPAHGVFFIKTDKSGVVKVIGYGKTKYLNPNITRVSQITVGMKVVVAGTLQSNGYLLARTIIAFKPKR